MKRIITAALAAVLAVFLLLPLASCAKSTTLLRIDPTAEEKRVVGKIGEFDVYYDELRYITMTYKDQLANKYGKDIWKTRESAEPYMAELSELVYSNITANYGVLTLAAENGITLDNDRVTEYCYMQMEEIASSIIFILKGNYGAEEEEGDSEVTGDETTPEVTYDENYNPTAKEINEAYKELLAEAYLTDRYVRFAFSVDACVEQIVLKYIEDGKLYTSDADIEKYIKSNFYRTLHVYVRNDKGESVDENRAIAESLRAELDAGASFNSIVGGKYNDDWMTTTSNGNYFTKGEMDERYESAVVALKIGEYSDVVETEGGFYIIKRLELKDDYINTYFENLKVQYQYAAVNSDIQARRDALSLVLNEFGASIELWNMK